MLKRKIYILFFLVLGISCQERNQTIKEFGKSVFLTYKTGLMEQKKNVFEQIGIEAIAQELWTKGF